MTNTNTNTDIDTETADQERRIERMITIEQELREHYESCRSNTNATENAAETDANDTDTDSPADLALDDYTARVVDFDRYRQRGPRHGQLKIEYLTHDGEINADWINWPDDPTDPSEPLVRLCSHLNIPLTNLADLHGEYIPVTKTHHGDTNIDMPPIQTLGNRLLYWSRRKQATTEIPLPFDIDTEDITFTCLILAWLPIYHILVYLFPIWHEGDPSLAGLGLFFVSLALFIAGLGSIIGFVVTLGVLAAAGLKHLKRYLKHRLFPTADDDA